MLNSGADAADRGAFEEAAALSLRSLEIAPSIVAHWNAGQAYAGGGDWPHALEQYDQALADPHLPKKERPRIEARRQLARSFVDAATATQAGRWDDARAAHLAILNSSADDVSEQDRAHATAALDQLAAARAADQAAQRERERLASPPPPATPPGPEPSSTAAPAPAAAPPHVDIARPSRFADTAALVMLGAGVVGVGVGAGFTWHARDLSDQADAEGDQGRARDLAASADRSRTTAAIAFAAGGAIVVAGLVKFVIAPDAPRAPSVAVTPAAGGAIVTVGGRF